MKKVKPTTSAQRHVEVPDYSVLTKTEPLKNWLSRRKGLRVDPGGKLLVVIVVAVIKSYTEKLFLAKRKRRSWYS